MRTSRVPEFEVIEGWQQLPEGHLQRDAVGVGVDSRDRVYVFTRNDSRVMVFNQDGSFVTRWDEVTFGVSHGITVGPDDSIHCADIGNHTVRKFTPEGKLLMTLGAPGVASDTGFDRSVGVTSVLRAGPPFNRPTNLGVAPNGDLYVTDGYGNCRVHRFSADGRLIQSWGEPGIGPGQFHIPHDVRVASDGRVMVADRENERIQIFSPTGEFLDQWTDVQRPTGLHIDRDELVYVTELWWWPGQRSMVRGVIEKLEPGRVSVFNPSGQLLARWGGVANCCAPGNVCLPHSVCTDSRGDLYVAEVIYTMGVSLGRLPEGCHTLQKFARKG